MEAPSLGTSRLLACALVALALSGCVDTLRGAVYQPTPEPPVQLASVPFNGTVYDANLNLTASNGTFPSADGTLLFYTLLVPNVSAKVPGVVLFQHEAYPPTGSPSPDFLPVILLNDALVFRSYAVAIVDMRGTGRSGGCVDLGGSAAQADAAAAVEWMAKLPSSNGRVAVVGTGDGGSAAIMAAARKAPHLAAIVPIDPTLDVFARFTEGGAKLAATGPQGAADQTVLSPAGLSLSKLDPTSPPDPPGKDDPRLARAKDQSCAVGNNAFADDPSGARTPWAQERDLRSAGANATTPLFLTLGLMAQPGQADPWYASYAGPKRAYVWQSSSGLPLSALVAGRDDPWGRAMIAFLDHELWGYQNGFEATYGLAQVQDSLGRWRNETAWPPTNATTTSLVLAKGHLATNGSATALMLAADDSESVREDVREDAGPIGAKTGALERGTTPTRLVYSSEPLAAPLHVSGRPILRVNVEADRPNAFVVAHLYRVLPDGSWVLENRGVRTLTLRDGDSPSPAQPGTTYALAIPLQPDDVVVRAGERIGLMISSDDASFVLPSPWAATTTIHYGGATPSALTLPVIQDYHGDLTTWDATQPTWRGPHAFEVRT